MIPQLLVVSPLCTTGPGWQNSTCSQGVACNLPSGHGMLHQCSLLEEFVHLPEFVLVSTIVLIGSVLPNRCLGVTLFYYFRFLFVTRENYSGESQQKLAYQDLTLACLQCQCPITPLCQYASMPVRQYASTPLRQYASTPVRQYASMPVRQYASMPVCQYTSTPAV